MGFNLDFLRSKLFPLTLHKRVVLAYRSKFLSPFTQCVQFPSSERIYKRISRNTTKERKPSNDHSDVDDVTDSEDSQRVVSPSGCLLSCTKFTIKYMYRYQMKYFIVFKRLISNSFMAIKHT